MDLGINHNIREKSYYIIQNVARLTIYYILGSLALTFIPKVSSSLKLAETADDAVLRSHAGTK